MRATLIALALTLTSCTPEVPINALDGEIVDLTHAYDENTPFWPTADGFRLTVDFAGETDGGYWYEANSFCTAEHGGTHLDAPVHFAEGRHSTEEIPVERLVGQGIVIDVSERALADPDYQVSVDDLNSWEGVNGSILPGSIVLIKTGFARFWPDRMSYMGTDERGAEAVAKLHFPGLHPEAATWLAERGIDALGIDTPSIDFGQSTMFESHRILFEANIPAFENVASMDRLPARGSTVIALPMKIARGSGGPLRIIAILPAVAQ